MTKPITELGRSAIEAYLLLLRSSMVRPLILNPAIKVTTRKAN